MKNIDALKNRRNEVLDKLKMLEKMRRGSVVEQVYEFERKDGSKGKHGPYLLYSFKDKGKSVSRRITNPKLEALYKEQIEAFRRFKELTAELVRIGEQIADLALADDKAVKKTLSKRIFKSKRTKK